MILSMEFAKKMKLLLDENGMRQKEFAVKGGMDPTHANKFFTGRKPNMDFLMVVKKVFPSVDLNWLLMPQHEDNKVSMLEEEQAPYHIDRAIQYLDEVEEKIKALRVVLTQK